MTRATEEWIGATDDARPPPFIRLRVFIKFKKTCPKCTRSLEVTRWDCDHIVALENGGENRESNLQPLCISPCHSDKTKADRKVKAKTDHMQRRHFGIQNERKIRAWRKLDRDRTPVFADRKR